MKEFGNVCVQFGARNVITRPFDKQLTQVSVFQKTTFMRSGRNATAEEKTLKGPKQVKDGTNYH